MNFRSLVFVSALSIINIYACQSPESENKDYHHRAKELPFSGSDIDLQPANRYQTFHDWKRACDQRDRTNCTESPLTREELLTQVYAFCKVHNEGPLSKKRNWIKTDSDATMPDKEFFTGKVFDPYVQKIRVDPGRKQAYFYRDKKGTTNFCLKIISGYKIAVHGDAHGDIDSVNGFIEFLAQHGYCDPNDPFKIKDKRLLVFFLGDLTDRGRWGAEVIYTLARLKCANPDNTFFTRGNHEEIAINLQNGFGAELEDKFEDYDHGILKEVSRIYNYMPVAIILQAGENALFDMHGGLDIGFIYAHRLLDAKGNNRFICLDMLNRKTEAQKLPLAYQPTLRHVPHEGMWGLRDFKTKKTVQWHCFADTAPLGFLWFDFKVDSNDHPADPVIFNPSRGWALPQRLTQYLLDKYSTPTCRMRGILRAHQHYDPMLSRIHNVDGKSDPDDAGVAKLWLDKNEKQPAGKLWDGIVCTFSVSPNTGYPELVPYNYDSFGILQTAEKFEDWRLQMHRIKTLQET